MPFYLFLRRLRRSPAALCGLVAIALLGGYRPVRAVARAA